jgi:glycosyltransferase involved in cell wall biosynthesis
MKILHVSTPLTWRGGEQQLAYLIEELREKDIEQVVLCADGSAVMKYCQANNIPYHTFNRKKRQIVCAKMINEICEHDGISLIHTHDSHAHTAAVISSIFHGTYTPIIVSRRTIFPIGTNWLSRLKYNHSSVDRIVCVSETIREQASKSILEKRKLVTVHSGIDLERSKTINDFSIRLSDCGENLLHPFIGNISAISEEKDLFTFVNTAESYFNNGKQGTFFIVGDGSYRTQIENYIEEKGLKGKVILTGFQNNIMGIIKQFDCFLFTSHTEGLGTSLLDAMSCHIPVVATKTGGIPEIVINGYNGLLAPIKNAQALADCLIKITENPVLRRRLTYRASEHIYNFTKQKMALQTLSIYQQVIYEKSLEHVQVSETSHQPIWDHALLLGKRALNNASLFITYFLFNA